MILRGKKSYDGKLFLVVRKILVKKEWCFVVTCIVLLCLIYDSGGLFLNCFHGCADDDSSGAPPAAFPLLLTTTGRSDDEHRRRRPRGWRIENERTVSSDCVYNLSRYNEGRFFRPDESLVRMPNRPKIILTMVGSYGSKHFGFGFGSAPFKAACCKQSDCFLTNNRQLLPIDQYDALIFHYRTMLPTDLPRKRSPHQNYILFDLEPSAYLYQDPQIYDAIFNLTWNFRHDADITFRYGRVLPKSLLRDHRTTRKRREASSSEGEKEKKQLVTWFVSRCSSVSWREHFVESLQKYIRVDIYGDCGNLTCSTVRFNQCYEMAEKKYKFYLSFENSLCKDYVTEKFFNILKYDMVPVVYGGADYASIAPDKSYINARDFKDTRALANYLLYLDRNTTAYNDYFKWKEDFFLSSYWGNHALNLCALCDKLHQQTPSPSIYRNLTDYLMTKAKCTRISPIPWWERWLSS